MTLETHHHNIDITELDEQSYLHPFTSVTESKRSRPWMIEGGSGIHITDSKGQTYIDATSGLICVNVGYGREEVARAIYDQARKLSYFHTFWGTGNEPAARLADRIVDITPGNMRRVMFGTSGSDANDTQIKLCWYYNNVLGRPMKKKIIARERGYHGTTLAAASVTGMPGLHKLFDLPLPQVIWTSAPDYGKKAEPGMSERDFSRAMARELEDLIEAEGPDTVAAFIGEPVMGSSSGVLVPPEGYFEEIGRVLRKHDILFIADEVVNGFGRVGAMFASELYGLEPDLMTLSKGLTSGYVPMSGAVVSDKVWQVLVEASTRFGVFEHGYTNSGHPVAAAAALASLDIIERENLVENAARVGAYLQKGLRDVIGVREEVREIRGVGLMAGIELVEPDEEAVAADPAMGMPVRVMRQCYEEGLIIRATPGNRTMVIAPPLIITEQQVDEVLERLERGLKKALGSAPRAG